MSKPKLLITGGHLTPALSFIDFCQAERPEIDLVFAGREFAQKDNGQLSWEKTEIDQRGIPFIAFDAVKTGSFHPLHFFHSYRQALQILTEQKITHVLSFGGYLAIPFALGAAKLKLSLVTHEQTRVLGRANRLISLFAEKIAVSFPDVKTPFPAKTVFTGLPLREQIFDADSQPPSWFTATQQNLPLIYLSGGSQGSRTMNENLLPILDQLTPDFVILHQVGRASARFSPLTEIQTYLREHGLQTTHYFPREFLTAEELAYFYPRLHLAVSRAGANTVAELTAFAVPTLYIPLPIANYDEQNLNAQALVQQKAALILPQDKLLPSELLTQINYLTKNHQQFHEQLKKIPLERLANERIFELFDFRPPSTKAKTRLKQEA